MLNPFEVAKRWKYIKGQVNNIPDPLLRDAIMADYKNRAIAEWGYCPDNTQYKSIKQIPELDAYEENLLKRIKMAKEYGYFERDEKIEKEFKARMKEFITKGGKWNDLPKDLQNEFVLKSYLGTIYEQIEECINFLENN